MTYKKKKLFLVISANCEGYPFLDFVRAVDKEESIKIVALARPEVVESAMHTKSMQDLEDFIHSGVKAPQTPNNAFDLLRQFGEIDDTLLEHEPHHIAAAHEGLPGKKLKTRETMFADSLWADEKTGKTRVVTLPVGARATVALRPDTSLGSSHPEGTFRIVFDLPVKDMYCNFYEVLNRFLPAGKKGWNL